jgi:hypothetical protein
LGNAYKSLAGKYEAKRPLGRFKRRWGMILKWNLKKYSVRMWTGFNWFRVRSNGGLFEHDNEPSGSIIGGKFVDQLSKY